jgi:hypothetical protein
MNKFLRISGVLFWLQIAFFVSYGLYVWFNYTNYKEEVNRFTESYITDILKNHEFDKYKSYFDRSVDNKELESIFLVLEKLGRFKDCDLSFTVLLPEPKAEITGECFFQNHDAEFDFQLSKNDYGWLITHSTITSDAYNLNL